MLNEDLVALVFPGQGAHSPQMLDGVRHLPNFATRYAVVTDALGCSPLSEFAAGHTELVNENRVAALLTVLASSLALDLFHDATGARAAFTGGYSVGQWTALYATGALTFEQLVAVVAARSAFMDACSARTPGAMLAVIGLKLEPLESLCIRLRDTGHRVWVSNHNCVGQYSLGGTISAIEAAEVALLELSPRKVVRIPVAMAGHTPLMATANTQFQAFLTSVPLAPVSVPVVDNVTGAFLPSDRDALCRQLADQLDHPVRWDACIRTLVSRGSRRVVEIGYGNVLTKFGFFLDRSVEHRAFYVN